MSRSKNQKLKLLYLAKIMQQQTDDHHGLTMSDIIEELQKYEIEAQRKSIYDDLATLDDYGIEIIREKQGNKTYYHCGSRDFEFAELKLLVDAIQSSKFITEKKSKELIRKLESNLSFYDASLMNRQVFVSNRVKSMNESIYITVDSIHTAMNGNLQVRFQYFQWDVDGKMHLKHDGDFYKISPWALVWDDENYYMVGYDQIEKQLKHYRIDKMLHTEVISVPRKGKVEFEKTDKEYYTQKRFQMYCGTMKHMELLCHNSIANVIYDRFGAEAHIRRMDENHFTVRIDLAVSPQFFGWVFGLGENIRIERPQEVREEFKQYLHKIMESYEL